MSTVRIWTGWSNVNACYIYGRATPETKEGHEIDEQTLAVWDAVTAAYSAVQRQIHEVDEGEGVS